MTLVDTNIIVDLLSDDPVWFAWSSEHLQQCRSRGAAYLNEITYAELTARIAAEADLQTAISELGLVLERAPTSALFLAGRAFARYRAAGGPRTSMIADFLIGAHAEIEKIPILTRDVRRYRAYFPDVTLIAPPV